MSTHRPREPRLPLAAADAGDDDAGSVGTVLDRFLTGFEWAIPTTFVLTPDELAWSVARRGEGVCGLVRAS